MGNKKTKKQDIIKEAYEKAKNCKKPWTDKDDKELDKAEKELSERWIKKGLY